ncbi:MAG: hypothetical protein ACPGU5_07170 [Lishizhenia sp.]
MENYNTYILIALFSIGATIFYVLSSIERSCLPIVFNPKKENVSETNIRLTHSTLKRLTPLLPPSYGVVVLGGIFTLFYQSFHLGWSMPSIIILALYFIITLYTLLIVKVGSAVLLVKKEDSFSGDLHKVKYGVKRLIISHHWGLIANLIVLLLEFFLIV